MEGRGNSTSEERFHVSAAGPCSSPAVSCSASVLRAGDFHQHLRSQATRAGVSVQILSLDTAVDSQHGNLEEAALPPAAEAAAMVL